MTIGIIYGPLNVVGLINEIDYGGWDARDQKSYAFGTNGVSTIRGGLAMRPFAVSIIVWGYGTPALRDADFMVWELGIGSVFGLTLNAATLTLANFPSNIRLAGIKPGRPGYDDVHLFYRSYIFFFEQLEPPPAPT
jgi:hypothetical protein